MATVNWTVKTGRTTGIAAQAVAAGANYLGNSIDNASNKDRFCDISISSTFGTAPTADKTIELYVLYSDDGTSYELGDASTDPKKTPVAVQSVAAIQSEQIAVFAGLQLAPRPFKILVKSEADQSDTITVLCETYNEAIA